VRLRSVVQPIVASAGYDLEAVSVRRVGRRHIVRVVVDGDAGVSLAAVAELSRAVSSALDASERSGGELFAGEYELEVSSPGVDRPLTEYRHWRRNLGRLVRVTVHEHPVTGRVTAADEAGVVLDVDGEARRVPYEALGPGRVQVELTRLADVADGDLDEIDDEEGEDEE
jgi:ribosome maturation factor RimP